jgi:hypothetical protein
VSVPIVSNEKCKNMFLAAGRHEVREYNDTWNDVREYNYTWHNVRKYMST